MGFSKMAVIDFNDTLYKSYPKFFDDSFWGVECSAGWYNIVFPLCEKLSKLDLPETFRITQVKEKFGELRIYTSVKHPEVDALIREAEKLSTEICEVCGAKDAGTSSIQGYVRTLCNACYKEKHNAAIELVKA